MIDWEKVIFGESYFPWSKKGKSKRKGDRLKYANVQLPGSYDSHTVQRLESFKATIAYGIEATRAAAYINAGMAVGVFGLLQKVDQNSAKEFTLGISEIIFMLGFGVLLSGMSSGLSYIAQGEFTEEIRSMTYDPINDRMKTSVESVEARYNGEVWRRVAIGCYFLSYIMLLSSLVCVIRIM